MQMYHLVPDGGHWILKPEGSESVLADFDSKQQAVESSVDLIREKSGSLKIHNADGTIEEERTYPRTADPVKSEG
jgi:Uncharacterized protein conserved in bacteria (DUF2188)